MLTPQEIKRFWQKVDKRGPDECWPWIGSTSNGVAMFHTGPNSKRVGYRAPRLAALLSGGAIVPGVNTKSTCGNSLCCNPAHRHVPLRVESVEPTAKLEYNGPQRNTISLGQDGDDFLAALAPLYAGKSVALEMEKPRIQGAKKTVADRTKKLVLLVPGTAAGIDPQAVLVSVVGSGSCIVWPKRNPQVANLVLAGMPAKLAVSLMDKLHRIFQE